MYTQKVTKVLYCYAEYLDAFEGMKQTIDGLILHQGLPSPELMEELSESRSHWIVCLDDMQEQLNRSKDGAMMFTRGCHHKNYSLIYLAHNVLGSGGAFARLISLSSHYMILFRQNRDFQQISCLGRQLFGKNGQTKFFMSAYEQAISKQYGYLFIDNHPHTTEDTYRLRTHIIPSQQPTLVYTPKNI